MKTPTRGERSERTKPTTASCCLWHLSFRREKHDRACHRVPQRRPHRRYHGARRRSSRSPWGLDGSSRLADDGCSMGSANRLNTEQPNSAPRRVPVLQREPATCALCRLNTFRARTPPALRELVRMGCGLSQVDKVGTGGKDRVQSAWDGGQGSWYVCFLSIVFFHKKEKEGERRERKRKKKVLSSEKERKNCGNPSEHD